MVAFATEGPPEDSGKPLAEAAEKFRKAAHGRFESIRIHTPKTLRSLDSSWAELTSDLSTKIKSDDRFVETLPWNEDWARIGLSRWKPRLIHHELISQMTNQGDIVFYHDSDVIKYPLYLTGLRRWAPWLKKRMTNLDVLAFNDHDGARLWEDVKPELIEHYLAGKEIETLEHLWAGAIAIRKSADGIRFARTWADHTSFEAVSPFTRLPSPDGFHWNSCEQAVLTVLWHSDRYLKPSIRREIQSLFRSRAIPPPSIRIRILRKGLRRLRRNFSRFVGARQLKT